jgi:hypothetical protein
MKLLSLVLPKRFTPAWKFSARHILWRVMFSEFGHIICEDRDTESKTTSFFCIDRGERRLLWDNKNFGEQWWIGLSAITKDRLYLHGFRKPDMPEQKNIIAVDLFNGNVLWKNTDCTFIGIQSPYIFGYKDLFERRVYYKIDEITGAMIEEMSALPEGLASNTQYERTDFTFPEQVSPENDPLWKQVQNETGFKSAEYITTEKYIILNVYSLNSIPDEGLKNTLSVIDSSTKKKVYSDVLNGSTQYPVPDSFFMDGERVYYIKERKTLVALDLLK